MIPWILKHEKFGDKPWAVQAEAMKRSAEQARYGFLMDCGLGKTAATLNKWANSGLPVHVVICPNSFKKDWTLAPAAWGLHHVDAGFWPKHPVPTRATNRRQVYAMNYEALRGRGFDELVELMKAAPVFLTFDETTYLKHHDSQMSKAALDLSKRAKGVAELNGTPYTQTIMDFFAPLKCLGLLNGRNPKDFERRYASRGGYMGKQVVGWNPDTADELWRLIDSRNFRATKADWRKDLPAQIFSTVEVDMSEKQAKHYREMQDDFFTASALVGDPLGGKLEVDATIIVTQMGKLRQISGGLLMKDGAHAWIDPPEKNPKARAVLEIARTGRGKTIVVYHYRPTGQMLRDMFAKEGLNPAWLRGRMDPEELSAEKARFNDDPACRVYVVQQEAGCMGHDMLGGYGDDRATKIAYFENSFSLRDRLQMNDRNYRGEADQDCTVYDVIASPSDRHAARQLANKKEAADDIDAALAALRERP